MSARIDAFLTEVRNQPAIIAAVAKDHERIREIDAIGRALFAVDRLANEDPAILDILDKIQAVVGRDDLSIKERLLEVGKLLVQVRDTMKRVH
jgi:hypothetical protein